MLTSRRTERGLRQSGQQGFMAAWAKAYNRPPTVYASQSYDTALAIGAALKGTGGKVDDTDAFRAAC